MGQTIMKEIINGIPSFLRFASVMHRAQPHFLLLKKHITTSLEPIASQRLAPAHFAR
jgi:hypothetical protein